MPNVIPDALMQHCETCKWWEKNIKETDPGGDEYGYCHRFPPVTLHSAIHGEIDSDGGIFFPLGQRIDATTYPVTEFGDFCGEWKETE